MVSEATGMEMCVWLIVEYLGSFLVAAASADEPGVVDAEATRRCEGVHCSGTPGKASSALTRHQVQAIWAFIDSSQKTRGFFSGGDVRASQRSPYQVIDWLMAC